MFICYDCMLLGLLARSLQKDLRKIPEFILSSSTFVQSYHVKIF